MYDDVLGFLREARAVLNDECEQNPLKKTRELSLVITKIDEAILWRQEDLRLKQPVRNECRES